MATQPNYLLRQLLATYTPNQPPPIVIRQYVCLYCQDCNRPSKKEEIARQFMLIDQEGATVYGVCTLHLPDHLQRVRAEKLGFLA